LQGRVRLATGARRVLRDVSGVTVIDTNGARRRFDDVVLATHAGDALRLLDAPDAEERRLLGRFRYTENRAVLHQDSALMPRRRRVWSSWNYIGDDRGDEDAALCVTYWMNRLQGLDERQPLFVTLNPIREPARGSVKRTFTYSHPLFDHEALQAQKDLWTLQGNRRTWFCGSYFGYGFHEDGLQAGLAVAEELGGVRRPWHVPAESGRIRRSPTVVEHAE
jgi:predicted NAD/FAD-binding protein